MTSPGGVGIDAEDLGGIRLIGLDISEVAVQTNRWDFPGLEFDKYDLSRDPLPRRVDLVLCFDVLIHQTSREQFTQCLNHLLDGIARHALVSYKNPGQPRKAIMPHLDEFDPAVEAEFRRSLAELQAKEQYPKAKGSLLRRVAAPHLRSVRSSRSDSCRGLQLPIGLRNRL